MASSVTVLGLVLNGIGQGSLYALVAVGFSLVLSSSGVIDFARGQLVAVGTLTTWSLTQLHGFSGLGLLVVLAACVLLVGVIGAVEEPLAVALIPRDRRLSGALVSTLGFGIVVQAITIRAYGSASHSVDPHIAIRGFGVGDIPIDGYTLVVIAAAIVVVGATWVVLRSTGAGRALRAVAEDREAAALRGVNVTVVAVGAFAVAGALTGLGGFVLAPLTFAFASQAPYFTIKGFVAMVVGGTGSIWGALVGGYVVGIAEQLGSHYLDAASKDLFGLAVLLAILLLRPQGIFASRRLRSA